MNILSQLTILNYVFVSFLFSILTTIGVVCAYYWPGHVDPDCMDTGNSCAGHDHPEVKSGCKTKDHDKRGANKRE